MHLALEFSHVQQSALVISTLLQMTKIPTQTKENLVAAVPTLLYEM